MLKFKYTGKKIFDEEGNELTVSSYQGYRVVFGDIIELDDFFAKKAGSNPDYELYSVKSVDDKQQLYFDRAMLEKKARELGIKFRSTISSEKLQRRIDEKAK